MCHLRQFRFMNQIIKNVKQNNNFCHFDATSYRQYFFSDSSQNEFKIDKEVQLSINILLLLGITIEGIINEIGETYIDSWTWKELEKVSTPLKWRIISGLKKGFNPSEKPLQTIIDLQKLRNKIAHAKLENFGNSVILTTNKGLIKKNPEKDYRLPDEDFKLYIGYENLLKDYNARNSLRYIKEAFKAIEIIKELFVIKTSLGWCQSMHNQVKLITVDKSELDD